MVTAVFDTAVRSINRIVDGPSAGDIRIDRPDNDSAFKLTRK